MDIWMRWCTKQARCRHCPDPILPSTKMVVGKLWRRREGETRRYTITLYWHPQCWIDQAVIATDKVPYEEVPKAGRPKLQLSEDQQKVRLKLLHRRADLTRRLKNAAMAGNLEKVVEVEVLRQELISQIGDYGPVPKRWTPHA